MISSMGKSIDMIRKHWIWALLGTLISLGLGTASYYLQYKSIRHDLGGFLNATFHSRTLNNKDSRTIVVCVDDTTKYYQNIYITPTFDNPDEYSLRDFSLNFETTSEGVTLMPSSFVKEYITGDKTRLYKYEQDVLQAHMDTKNPFMGFKLKNDFARCEVVSKVSFDGAASLFQYRTDIWFVYTPNRKNLSFDYWKLNCKQKLFNLMEEKSFDIYYISKKESPEYQFDVILSSNNVNSKNKNDNRDFTDTKIKPNVTKSDLVTIAEYSIEDTKANSNLEISDYLLLPGDTIKCEIFFNQPVRKTGKYIIKYVVKDGWKLKNCYSIAYLKEGYKGCSLTLNEKIKKIANLEIYHQVNAESILDISKNNNGYLSFTLKNPKALVALNYDDGGCYFRNGGLNAYFDKAVTIETFNNKQTWWERIIKDENGSDNYIFYYIFFGLLGILFILLYISEKSEKIDNLYIYTTYGGLAFIFLFFGLFLLVILYYAVIFLYNYIYLII